LPVRRPALTSPAYRSQVGNGAYTTYAYILEHLPESPWPGRYPWFPPAYDWLANEGLPAVMRGASDAESILSKAQSRALAAMTEVAEAGHAAPVVTVQRPTVPPDTIDLTFLSWANVETYAELAHLYEDEHPGVTIDMADFASGTDYPPGKLADAADVFPSPGGFSLSSVQEHWLNLQPLIENDPGVTLDDFYPQALQAYRRQGDLWGLPAEIDAAMLFYNKSLFDAAGVDYPRPGWTWDNFLMAAARLTWGTGAEKQWGFVTLTDGWAEYPLALAAQRGGCLVDSRTSPTAPTLDDPAVVDAVRWYADLSQAHGVMPPSPVHYADWQTMEALVSEGQAAMWISSVGARYWVRMKRDLGVAPLPVPSDGGQLATVYSVIGYAISARTPHPQEAWRWLTFLTRQPEAMRALPARRSLANQATFPLVPRSLKPEVLRAYQLTLEDYADAGYDGVRDQIPWFDAVYRLYRQAVRQTLENGDDPSEALGSAQTIAEAYIACLEAHGELDDKSVAAACEKETGVPPLTAWYEE
jgi:multiple sugar transport system substrate-binding protein